jgi:tetratricopeptide (TPR) repeat protein
MVLDHARVSRFGAVHERANRGWNSRDARGLSAARQYETALDALATAREVIEKSDERYYEAENYRLTGEIQIEMGAAGCGESSLRQAIGIARRQEAKLLELRAALALARLLRDSDRADEARSLLQPLDAWFTEGRDSAKELTDLREVLQSLALPVIGQT